VNDDVRVIDVIRDALFVFGEALDATGDAFAMVRFSSVRRSHVRIQLLKDFDEVWAAATQARVGAVKPGYYTRMGAALRWATRRLEKRPERERLLLILTDGKPNDIDVYEGRWGMRIHVTRCGRRGPPACFPSASASTERPTTTCRTSSDGGVGHMCGDRPNFPRASLRSTDGSRAECGLSSQYTLTTRACSRRRTPTWYWNRKRAYGSRTDPQTRQPLARRQHQSERGGLGGAPRTVSAASERRAGATRRQHGPAWYGRTRLP